MSSPQINMNTYITEYISKDYAGETPPGEIRLDCSLGVNSDPLGNCVFQRLHEFSQRTDSFQGNYDEIKYYPHGSSLRDALADWYKLNGVGEGWIAGDNFILGNGSYDILCGLNLLCLTHGKAVLGHAPQFTAYIDHVHCSGSRYEGCRMESLRNFRFEAEDYIARMVPEYDMFIVENPNNPTGQIIPLWKIREIAQKALELNRVLVLDEAYAEYMPFDNSAINLVPDFPNLIVTRSFSKGWGMAGVRLGYGVASNELGLLTHLQKVVLPFNCNGLARTLAQTALRTRLEHPDDPFGVRPVERSKQRLLDTILQSNQKWGRNLQIAETYKSTPILMIYYNDAGPRFHLQQHLLESGILTVSCQSYAGLDQRAVRLMLPEEHRIPLLLELMDDAIRRLPKP